MTLKEKIQEWKDIKKVRKSASALGEVQNQTDEVVLEAFLCHGTKVLPLINDLTPELFERLVCRNRWSHSGSLLRFLPEDKITQEICIRALRIANYHLDDYLNDIPENYRTYEVYRFYITEKGSDLRKVPREHWTEDLLCSAVLYNSDNFQWIPPELQTEKICLIAVRRDGLSLKHVAKQTKEICFEAVGENRKALMYVEDKDVAQLAALYAN